MRLLFAEQLEYALGARDLLSEIHLELRHGQKLALVGANGAGKTTLLRLLLGQLEPTRGRVLLTRGVHLEYLEQDARFTSGQTVQQVLSRGFARLEQMEGELAALEGGLADPDTYHRWEALHEQFQALGGYSRQGKLKAVLAGLGFAGREEQSADSLSGGEARRLLLGSLLLSAADALFLDEPTNDLDLQLRAAGLARPLFSGSGGPPDAVSQGWPPAVIRGQLLGLSPPAGYRTRDGRTGIPQLAD